MAIALLAAGGATAALANFVPWPVAVLLGLASGALGLAGTVVWECRAAARVRLTAWASAVDIGPSHGAAEPGSLLAALNPDAGITPYNQLHLRYLNQLQRWAAAGGNDALGQIVALAGAAGGGKTRLLVELATNLAREGVLCGWVRPGHGAEAVAAAAGFNAPVLLIVDNADTHTDLPDLLAGWHHHQPPHLAVVLAARDFGPWWTHLRRRVPPEVSGRLPARPAVTLPALATSPRNQRQNFTQLLRAYADHFQTDPPVAQLAVTGPAPGPLLVHAAAVLAVEQRTTGTIDTDTVVGEVFSREEAHWSTSAAAAGLGAVPALQLGQAVIMTTLIGAADPDAADGVLACLPGHRLAPPQRADLAIWLRGLYPLRTGYWLAPHLPALLFGYYIADHLVSDPLLAEAISQAVGDNPRHAERALRVLAYATAYQPAAHQAVTGLIATAPRVWVPAAITALLGADSVTARALDPTIATAITTTAERHTTSDLQQMQEQLFVHKAGNRLPATIVSVLRHHIAHLTIDNGTEHPHTLGIRHNLAGILIGQGRYTEAEAELRQTLSIQARNLGAGHPETAKTLGNLTVAVYKQGRYGEAEAAFGQVLDIQARTLGAEHPDTLNTRNNLANALHSQGRYGEAEAEFRQVLDTRARTLGAEHPDTVSARSNLATALIAQGRYEEAEAELRQVLNIQARVVGAEHPNTLKTRNNVAGTLQCRARYEEAETEFRQVLDIQARTLGAEHPDTLKARGNVAGILRGRTRYEEAEAELRQVLDIQARTLGPDHPDTLKTRNNVAGTVHGQGRYGEAEAEFRQVLDIQARTLGPEHPDTLNTRHCLADTLRALGREADVGSL
ncbi:tetratricopeptide repeat protein [Longispora fulva]|uniref:Tetratricopeptide (TPR) repeat protein n=1 Tax=Longispora fulva TaxID=619741 RepID=A0A8J7GDY0_9ACTN|nr:tetratricopeptide repeat protein [Longispora fulva]MBG6133943.1 tetratricopeptide (TPR) repeat protein [Longispora fulva]